MKFIHLADLHLGKKVNEYSMIDDQTYILNQILDIIKSNQVDSVLLAGDIYDRSTPPIEAIKLFDYFISELHKLQVSLCMIGGNHDSNERLLFASNLLKSNQIYIAPNYDGTVFHIELEDMYGSIQVYMLPYIKPVFVRKFAEYPITSFQDAMGFIMNHLQLDTKQRNVLVTHQFVTGAIESDSEELYVGGSENVDGTYFLDFDYVALGHLHRPQSILVDTMRYAGSPLKYSVSEVNHIKSVPIIELKEKGAVTIECIDLKPLRDIIQIKACFDTLIDPVFYKQQNLNNYFHIILEDEVEIVDALLKLREIYPNIMRFEYVNIRSEKVDITLDPMSKTPLTLFQELYELQNNEAMTHEQSTYIETLIEEIWGEQDANN